MKNLAVFVFLLIGGALIVAVGLADFGNSLPGDNARDTTLETIVAGTYGPCKLGGTGECVVTGTQSTCNKDNAGMTCGITYGLINEVCTGLNLEKPCDTWLDYCNNYTICVSTPQYGHQCSGIGPAAYSRTTCTGD